MTSSYEAWTWSHVPFGNLAQVMKSWAKSLKLTEKHLERHSKPLWGLLNLLVVLGECRFREHVAGVFNLWPAQRSSVQVKAGHPIARCMHLGTGFPKNWPDTAGLATNHCWQNNDCRGWDCEGGTGVKVFSNHAIHVISLVGAHDRRGDVSYCQVGPPVYVRNRRCQLEFFRPRELSPIPLAVLHQMPLTSHALSCSAPEESYLKRLDKFLMKLGPGGWQNLWQFHGTSCLQWNWSGYFRIFQHSLCWDVYVWRSTRRCVPPRD